MGIKKVAMKKGDVKEDVADISFYIDEYMEYGSEKYRELWKEENLKQNLILNSNGLYDKFREMRDLQSKRRMSSKNIDIVDVLSVGILLGGLAVAISTEKFGAQVPDFLKIVMYMICAGYWGVGGWLVKKDFEEFNINNELASFIKSHQKDYYVKDSEGNNVSLIWMLYHNLSFSDEIEKEEYLRKNYERFNNPIPIKLEKFDYYLRDVLDDEQYYLDLKKKG